MRRHLTLALAALALTACAPSRGPSPAETAVPHGSTAVLCPELSPAQPNCRVPR